MIVAVNKPTTTNIKGEEEESSHISNIIFQHDTFNLFLIE
jgi:hypothetical protein